MTSAKADPDQGTLWQAVAALATEQDLIAADAETAMNYHAETNNGLGMAGEQERKYAATNTARRLRALLDRHPQPHLPAGAALGLDAEITDLLTESIAQAVVTTECPEGTPVADYEERVVDALTESLIPLVTDLLARAADITQDIPDPAGDQHA